MVRTNLENLDMSELSDIITCRECGTIQEGGPVAGCENCGGGKIRRGAELYWQPWDWKGRRIEGVYVPVLAVKSRRRKANGKLDLLCEMTGGRGERWFQADGLVGSIPED